MSFSLLQESQFHHSHCSGVAELLLTTTLRRKKKKNSAHRLAWAGLGAHSSSHHQLAWNSLLHYCTAVLQAKHTSRTLQTHQQSYPQPATQHHHSAQHTALLYFSSPHIYISHFAFSPSFKKSALESMEGAHYISQIFPYCSRRAISFPGLRKNPTLRKNPGLSKIWKKNFFKFF